VFRIRGSFSEILSNRNFKEVQELCDKDLIFCFFYYLGFLSIAGALAAGLFIISDWRKKKRMEGR